jgi:hypothetical protein
MTMDRRKLALPVVMVCAVGGALALATLGGNGDGASGASGAAAALAPVSKPVEIALKPRHRSGVTGTATLTPSGPNLEVTLTLEQKVPGTLPAHIHTGPCSDEPTATNPRIWAGLTEVVGGRSHTTVNVVTLRELQSETSSINVHDPAHNLRALVCADIPQAG